MKRRREELDKFLGETCPDSPSGVSVLELELLTGCAVCGRRLLEAGLHVRDGVVVLTLIDEDTNVGIAQYAVCPEHAPAAVPGRGDKP